MPSSTVRTASEKFHLKINMSDNGDDYWQRTKISKYKHINVGQQQVLEVN